MLTCKDSPRFFNRFFNLHPLHSCDNQPSAVLHPSPWIFFFIPPSPFNCVSKFRNWSRRDQYPTSTRRPRQRLCNKSIRNRIRNWNAHNNGRSRTEKERNITRNRNNSEERKSISSIKEAYEYLSRWVRNFDSVLPLWMLVRFWSSITRCTAILLCSLNQFMTRGVDNFLVSFRPNEFPPWTYFLSIRTTWSF